MYFLCYFHFLIWEYNYSQFGNITVTICKNKHETNDSSRLWSVFWFRVKEALYNLDSILKSRDITLSTKVRLVKAMVPLVIYGCESWTIKKTEQQRIDAFELCCWRRLLRVTWAARRPNQSTLKEVSPGCSLEGLMLKLNSNTLATWCEELTHLKRPWCWERLKAGGEGDNRGWDGWMASPIQWTWVWVNSGSCWWQGGLVCCSSWGSKVSDTTEWLNWTERKPREKYWSS